MSKIRLGILLSITFLISGMSWAQDGQITGTVRDAVTGQALPGVNVVVQELVVGAATSVDGTYTIENVAPGQYTLVASFIGFKNYQVSVNVTAGQTVTQNIDLEEDLIGLDEVVVTGQGSGIEKRRLVHDH